jgi:hypothetical protein
MLLVAIARKDDVPGNGDVGGKLFSAAAQIAAGRHDAYSEEDEQWSTKHGPILCRGSSPVPDEGGVPRMYRQMR